MTLNCITNKPKLPQGLTNHIHSYILLCPTCKFAKSEMIKTVSATGDVIIVEADDVTIVDLNAFFWNIFGSGKNFKDGWSVGRAKSESRLFQLSRSL